MTLALIFVLQKNILLDFGGGEEKYISIISLAIGFMITQKLARGIVIVALLGLIV